MDEFVHAFACVLFLANCSIIRSEPLDHVECLSCSLRLRPLPMLSIFLWLAFSVASARPTTTSSVKPSTTPSCRLTEGGRKPRQGLSVPASSVVRAGIQRQRIDRLELDLEQGIAQEQSFEFRIVLKPSEIDFWDTLLSSGSILRWLRFYELC